MDVRGSGDPTCMWWPRLPSLRYTASCRLRSKEVSFRSPSLRSASSWGRAFSFSAARRVYASMAARLSPSLEAFLALSEPGRGAAAPVQAATFHHPKQQWGGCCTAKQWCRREGEGGGGGVGALMQRLPFRLQPWQKVKFHATRHMLPSSTVQVQGKFCRAAAESQGSHMLQSHRMRTTMHCERACLDRSS